MACLLPGCEDESIQSYQAPKAPAYVPPDPMGLADGHDHASPGITWKVPEGWQPVEDKSGMATATFEAASPPPDINAPGDSQDAQAPDPARITVTVLAGQAGGILGNINRWRRQVGLEPISSVEDQPMTGIQIDQSPAGLIDLVSPPDAKDLQRMLVVLIPRQQENQTWFFKMTGPDDTVNLQKQNFVAFVESVRFQEAHSE
jgi:hypothetical protein